MGKLGGDAMVGVVEESLAGSARRHTQFESGTALAEMRGGVMLGWVGLVWCQLWVRWWYGGGVAWCGGEMVWRGVVWCGVVWCGVACRGVVWCGVVWWCVGYGVVWCDVVTMSGSTASLTSLSLLSRRAAPLSVLSSAYLSVARAPPAVTR